MTNHSKHSRSIKVSIGSDLSQAITQQAEENGISKSQLLRLAFLYTLQRGGPCALSEAPQTRSCSLLGMSARYMFEAPSSLCEALWRLTSTLVLATLFVVSYGIAVQPDLVREVLGFRSESVEHRLIRILEERQRLMFPSR